jgi:hypothetical protein
MCKDIVVPIRPHVTVWHMSLACWIPKATNTLLECVILTVFHCNNGCMNVSQCYIILHYLSCVLFWTVTNAEGCEGSLSLRYSSLQLACYKAETHKYIQPVESRPVCLWRWRKGSAGHDTHENVFYRHWYLLWQFKRWKMREHFKY